MAPSASCASIPLTSTSIPPGFALVPIEALGKAASVEPKMTLSEFVSERFLPAKEGLSFLTLRGYLGDLKRCILPVLGDMPIDEIRHKDIQRMIDSCPTRKAAQTAKCTLSSVLGTAVMMDELEVNHAIGRYHLPRSVKPQEPPLGVWLTDWSQVALVLDAARAYDPGGEIERACLLGYGFGLRKGEILGVDWEDMDLEKGVLHVRRSFTRWEGQAGLHALKTDESNRDVPFMGYVLDRVRALSPGTGAFVTCGGKRSNPSSIAKRFAAFTRQMGLPHVTLFTMRHTFATCALKTGLQVRDVQMWLGHTSPVTTMRYARPDLATPMADVEFLNDELVRNLGRGEAEYPELDANLANSLRDVLGAELTDDAASACAVGGQTRYEDVLLGEIRRDPEATQKELAERVGVSPDFVKLMIANLRKRGLVTRCGGRKQGRWVVSDDVA